MRWVVQCFVFFLSATLVPFVVRAYRERLEEVRALVVTMDNPEGAEAVVGEALAVQAEAADLQRGGDRLEGRREVGDFSLAEIAAVALGGARLPVIPSAPAPTATAPPAAT